MSGVLSPLGSPNWHAWTPLEEREKVQDVQAKALERVARALRADPGSETGRAVRDVLTVLEIQGRARLDEHLVEPDPVKAERSRQEVRGIMDVYQMLIGSPPGE